MGGYNWKIVLLDPYFYVRSRCVNGNESSYIEREAAEGEREGGGGQGALVYG